MWTRQKADVYLKIYVKNLCERQRSLQYQGATVSTHQPHLVTYFVIMYTLCNIQILMTDKMHTYVYKPTTNSRLFIISQQIKFDTVKFFRKGKVDYYSPNIFIGFI